MARAIKFVVVAVCLLCILAVCISPVLDLPATNLRAYQAAVILLSALMSAAFCLSVMAAKPAAFLPAISFNLFHRRERWSVDEPVKLSSVLRC